MKTNYRSYLTLNNLPAAIFWDMDGTMIDSEPCWAIATYELSERFGKRMTPEVRETTVGGSFMNTVRICADYAGYPYEKIDVEHERQVMYQRVGELVAQLDPHRGLQRLLTQLAPLIPSIVTTNTERQLLDRMLEVSGRDYFVDSIAGNEVSNPKPDPEMYLEAARRVGKHPGECLVFEDSQTGMSAARDAGCVVIGFTDDVVDGVTSLRELHGNLSFEGVTVGEIGAWFAALR